MRHQGYFTRALRANDPRFARAFGRLGYSRSDLTAGDGPDGLTGAGGADAGADVAALREEYQRVVGRRAYHAWTSDELRARITAAGGETLPDATAS